MKKKLIDVLKEMFSSNNLVSMMRVTAFFVVVDIMTVWTITCISKGFTGLGWDNASLVAGVLGVKAIQSFAESSREKKVE